MEGGAGPQYNPRTVEAVFRDYKGRRAGLIKALTTDVVEFYQQCDPEKENLCLYAYPGGSWEVTLPAEEVPPELPEPALGINFARDGMQEKDWLSLVAVHSDAWLLSVSFYFAARFGFGRSERKRLFTLINDLPTIFEAVTGSAKKQETERPSVHKSGSKVRGSEPENQEEEEEEEEEEQEEQEEQEEEEDEEDDEVLDEDEEQGECAACGESYVSASEEFWICCDVCEKWYHGKCVKITPARADHIKHYKCPACNNKRSRP